MGLRTETTINAPSDAVWEVLTDYQKWPAWNTFLAVDHAKGPLTVGETINASFQPPGHKATKMNPKARVLALQRKGFVSEHVCRCRQSLSNSNAVGISFPNIYCVFSTLPQIVEYNHGSRFSWRGRVLNNDLLFVGEHYFELKPLGPKQTQLLHGEQHRSQVTGMHGCCAWR